MVRILCSLALVFGMFTLAGCGAQPGKTLVKYEKGSPLRMSEAPETATYALYKKSGLNPEVSYQLSQGDKLGFVEDGGKVYAVAGTHKDEVTAGTMGGYYWKMQTKK